MQTKTMLVKVLSAAALVALAASALAQADPYAEDRKQLRALLLEVESAISKLDIDKFLKHAHADATITWQNAEVSRGHDQIRAYYERMVGKANPVVKSFRTKAELGAPAVFYGPDVAIAYGTNLDHYELVAGLTFDLPARWTTTAVKRDGEWKIAALHFSSNLFDNPLLNRAEQNAWWFAAGGFVVGVVLALLAGRLLRRKRA